MNVTNTNGSTETHTSSLANVTGLHNNSSSLIPTNTSPSTSLTSVQHGPYIVNKVTVNNIPTVIPTHPTNSAASVNSSEAPSGVAEAIISQIPEGTIISNTPSIPSPSTPIVPSAGSGAPSVAESAQSVAEGGQGFMANSPLESVDLGLLVGSLSNVRSLLVITLYFLGQLSLTVLFRILLPHPINLDRWSKSIPSFGIGFNTFICN